MPKNHVDLISGLCISIITLYLKLFTKWLPGSHFGCPRITFKRIYRRFRSICNFQKQLGKDMACTSFFIIFSQNGCCRLFRFLPMFAKIDKVLPLWVINVRIKYEVDRLSQLHVTQAFACVHRMCWRQKKR